MWFGAISYSLYLWHWVILSFARLIGGEEPRIRYKIGLLILSVTLSWLTYRLIENPIRFGKYSKLKTFISIFILGIVGFIGLNTYERDGLPFRAFNKTVMQYPTSMVRTGRQSECFDVLYAYKKTDNWFCEIGVDFQGPSIFAYGDSHALSMLPALEYVSEDLNKKILFSALSGCPPVLGVQSMSGPKYLEEHNCKLLNERIFNYVKNNNIKNVILVSRWTYYTKSLSKPNEVTLIARNSDAEVDATSSEADLAFALKNTVNLYKNIGVNVYIVQDNPQQIVEPMAALKNATKTPYDWAINKYSITLERHVENQTKVNGYIDSSGAKIINFNSILCPRGVCSFVDGGKFLYFDDDHLSIYGAKKVAPELVRALSEQ